MKTYHIGETIELEVDVEDPVSGVGYVRALCESVTQGNSFSLQGDGGGQHKTKVKVSWVVTAEVPPGEYVVKKVVAQDRATNETDVSPPTEIRFRIVGPEDKKGPKIKNITLK